MSNDDLPAWFCLQLSLDQASAQRLSRLIDDQNILSGLSGYYEVLYDETLPKSDLTTLVLYFPPDNLTASSQIEILMEALNVSEYTIKAETIKRQDYLEAYKKHYTAFQISEHFVIVPSWQKEETKLKSSEIPIYLDPGLAFGTGKHPTTKLCLEWLDRNPPTQYKIIDAGCGSGILSAGALILKAQEIFAFDIDSNAVNSSKQNIDLNKEQIQGVFTIQKGGFDLPEFKEFQADLMIGNLTASILVQNVEQINSGSFDKLLLSGIILDQEEFVVNEFQQTWDLLERQELEGWLLLSFKRK